jgi:hypothetical protein
MQYRDFSDSNKNGQEEIMHNCFCLALAVILYLCSCSSPLSGGDQGGTVITNGYVMMENGKPAEGAVVTAYPSAFQPPLPADTILPHAVTEKNGMFILRTEEHLTFNLVVIDRDGNSGNVLYNLSGDTTVEAVTLSRFGGLSGTISGDSADAAPLVAGCVGTPFFGTTTADNASFTIPGLPPGQYDMQVYHPDNKSHLVNVAACSGEGCGTAADTAPIIVASDSITVIELKVSDSSDTRQ